MMERGVRFVQLFHRGWDQHTDLVPHLSAQCRDTDRGSAALVTDLKRRGLLDDTLVIWGGEFGRTAYSQGRLDSGRDHHGRCFTVWMAGGGVKGGVEHGVTDDHSYNVVDGGVHVSAASMPPARPVGDDGCCAVVVVVAGGDGGSSLGGDLTFGVGCIGGSGGGKAGGCGRGGDGVATDSPTERRAAAISATCPSARCARSTRLSFSAALCARSHASCVLRSSAASAAFSTSSSACAK